MVAMFLVATALAMSQSIAQIIGIHYAVNQWWVLTINRSGTLSCISGECREHLREADCCLKFADCPCSGYRIYSPRFLNAQLIYIRPTDLFYSLAFGMIIVPGDFLNGIVTLGLNLPHDWVLESTEVLLSQAQVWMRANKGNSAPIELQMIVVGSSRP